MNYSDLRNDPAIRAATGLALDYALTYPAARAVLQACRDAYAAGAAGRPEPKHVASRDLLDLVHDAWHDGIVERKLPLILDSDTDGTCTECSTNVESSETECSFCGSSSIQRMVMVSVQAPFACTWADWERTIDGSSWECDGDDFAYTILTNRPSLVEDLRDEGYNLDLTMYEEP